MKKASFTFITIFAAIVGALAAQKCNPFAHAAHAAAAPVVINFEDAPLGNVTNFYANLGVIFNQPRVLTYQSMPGFAHSGVKGVEQCYAAEFCNAPIEMSFTTGQRRVKVWVGYSAPLQTSRTVLLRALDANGAQIGQTTTVLAASTAARPVNTPLEISLPNPNIRRALVSFSPTDIAPYSLVVDDVEFDSAGPPPACTATQNPTLTIAQPAGAQTVQFNGFILQASVNTQDPLAVAMTMTVTGPGGTNSYQLPLASGKFGPTMMNGYLSPGANTVTLKFQDCKGVIQSSRTVTYSPIAAGTRFEMLGIEVTQATQEAGNSVPLVAGKPAIARVFLRIQSPLGASATIKDVFGRLVGQSSIRGSLGNYLPPGELKATNLIVVNTSDDLAAKRKSLDATVNFTLPSNWLVQGDLHLAFRPEVKDSPSSPSNIPCTNCDNLIPVNSRPHLVTFYPTKKMNLILAPYVYQPNNNPPFPLSAELLIAPSVALQWTNNVYPLPGNFPSNGLGINLIRMLPMRTTTRNLQTDGGQEDFLDDLRALYSALKTQGGIPSDTRLLAMVPCGCGGRAELSGHVGFADTWASENGRVPEASYEGYGMYWAHELGHTYGRSHAGNWHGEAGGGGYDANFPYFHGGIGAPGVALITEWWKPGGTPYLIDPGVTNPLGRHAHDFMSYGHLDPLNTGMWVSPYTYKNLFNFFRVNQTRRIEVISRATEAAAEPEVDLKAIQQTAPEEKLVVTGQVKADGSVHLHPFTRSVTTVSTGSGETGEFSIEMLDAQGRLLSQFRFDAIAIAHGDALSFTELAPWNTSTKRIALKRNGQLLASREVSSSAPTVRVLSPNGGEVLGTQATIFWEGNDADGDSLTYSVFYNNGADPIWWPVATDVTSTSISVDTSLWAGSTNGRIMVRATDGVNSADDTSDSAFTVQQKSPMVAILPTIVGAGANQEVRFQGFAFDPEDGFLPESSLIWTSDRGETIEKGRLLKLKSTVLGSQTITLTVTDSQGQSATTSTRTATVR